MQHYRTSNGHKLTRLILKNREPLLRTLFRDMAGAALAASMASVGCGNTHDRGDTGTDAADAAPDAIALDGEPADDSGPDGAPVDAAASDAPVSDGGTDADASTDAPSSDAGGEVAHCVEGTWQAVADLSLPETYDYLGAYETLPPGGAYLLHSVGTACSGASDATACDAAVQAGSEIYENHVTSTQGDAVRHWTSTDTAELLGPIDRPEDALLAAFLAGYSIGCDSTVEPVGDGYRVVATRLTSDCAPVEVTEYLLHVSLSAEVTVLHEEVISSDPGACIGRRPEGLERHATARASGPLGLYFAGVAHLEASAVVAFEVLARELEALGAPEMLVEKTRRSAREETRHAVLTGQLADEFGGEVAPVVVRERPLRSLFELALDNAVEGCVRETYGALVGTYQAVAARDPRIAATMREIADDETRHASLAWDIAAWAEPCLNETEREHVARARAKAIASLRDEVRASPGRALRTSAGLPSPTQAVAWVEELANGIWA